MYRDVYMYITLRRSKPRARKLSHGWSRGKSRVRETKKKPGVRAPYLAALSLAYRRAPPRADDILCKGERAVPRAFVASFPSVSLSLSVMLLCVLFLLVNSAFLMKFGLNEWEEDNWELRYSIAIWSFTHVLLRGKTLDYWSK